MAAERTPQDTSVNWSVVGVGIIVLMLVAIAIPDAFLRALVSAIIMFAAVLIAQSRGEPEVENPVLEELHRKQEPGLDRRKYGHLRTSTNNLLDHVRQMNKIAIDGREGKLAPRHAQAELDRIATKMRDLVDDIRKTAGVPTPMDEGAAKAKPAQPQIVIPKAMPGPPQGSHAPPPARKPEAAQPTRDADETLDELETSAKEAVRRRSEQVEPD
jgi:hypothetical protein